MEHSRNQQKHNQMWHQLPGQQHPSLPASKYQLDSNILQLSEHFSGSGICYQLSMQRLCCYPKAVTSNVKHSGSHRGSHMSYITDRIKTSSTTFSSKCPHIQSTHSKYAQKMRCSQCHHPPILYIIQECYTPLKIKTMAHLLPNKVQQYKKVKRLQMAANLKNNPTNFAD